jgi:hypothetical protein
MRLWRIPDSQNEQIAWFDKPSSKKEIESAREIFEKKVEEGYFAILDPALTLKFWYSRFFENPFQKVIPKWLLENTQLIVGVYTRYNGYADGYRIIGAFEGNSNTFALLDHVHIPGPAATGETRISMRIGSYAPTKPFAEFELNTCNDTLYTKVYKSSFNERAKQIHNDLARKIDEEYLRIYRCQQKEEHHFQKKEKCRSDRA